MRWALPLPLTLPVTLPLTLLLTLPLTRTLAHAESMGWARQRPGAKSPAAPRPALRAPATDVPMPPPPPQTSRDSEAWRVEAPQGASVSLEATAAKREYVLADQVLGSSREGWVLGVAKNCHLEQSHVMHIVHHMGHKT